MARIVERRSAIAQTPAVLAVMFGVGAAVALVWDVVPAWQNHGPDAGPLLVRRTEEPGLYSGLTASYCLVAAVTALLTFFRFPWVTLGHIRIALALLFLLMLLTPVLILYVST